MIGRMTRISVDVDDELLAVAKRDLGTSTKVATINAALAAVAQQARAKEAIAALDSVEMDFSGSINSFRYGGGRDLSRLIEDARESQAS